MSITRSLFLRAPRLTFHRGLRSRAFSSAPERAPSASTSLPKPRLDYRDISENVVFKSHNAFNRKASLPVGAVQTVARLYEEQKELSQTLNTKRHARSTVGDRIRGLAKDPQKKQAALDEAKALKAEISELEDRAASLEEELHALALAIPNDTHPAVPIGPESVAITLSTHGPELVPASPARDHVAICRALDLIDLEAGATVAGSSWYYLKNEGALLELALVNYALSTAMKHGFTPVTTPDVVRSDIARRCGFQPRDPVDGSASQTYHLMHTADPGAAENHNHPELVLAGTAEIPLAGMLANRILAASELPLKVVGLGHAFRAEAGARGADTRGLYRVHQFTKLELFALSEEEKSGEMMEEMRKLQTEIFEGLGLSFRCAVQTVFIRHRLTPLHTGFSRCQRKSSARARTANTTQRHGCLAAEAGAKSRLRPTAPTTKLVDCISGIAVKPLPPRLLLRMERSLLCRSCTH